MNSITERPVRISSVKPISGFTVEFEFTDGTSREIDLEKYLHGKVFERIRSDQAYFESIAIDKNSGTVCWDNGADIDPDVIFFDLEPAWAEEEALQVN